MEDLTSRIGEAAGAAYHALVKGDSSLTRLKKDLVDLGFNANVSAMAIGWLAREDKVSILKQGKIWTVKLK